MAERTELSRRARFSAAFPRLGRACDAIDHLIEDLEQHHVMKAAAAIAFWFFLSLIPLLCFIGFIFGHFIRLRGVDRVLDPFFETIPEGAEAIVRAELSRMGGATSTIGPLAVAGLLWTASSGVHTLLDVLELALHAERRSWVKQRVLSFGWVLLGMALLFTTVWGVLQVDSMTTSRTNRIATTASSAQAIAERQARRALPKEVREKARRVFPNTMQRAIAGVTLFAAAVCGLAGFYRFSVKHPKSIRRRSWPGAFTAVLSFLLVSWIFGQYVSSLGNYAVYYGSLAAVAILMIWLYLTTLSLIIGAEVNARLEGLRDRNRAA